MYTLILYDENDVCLDYYNNLEGVYSENNNVYWNNGYLEGIQVDYIILNDIVEIGQGELVTDLIAQDIKNSLLSQAKLQENQAQGMQTMINNILFDPTNFEQDQKITAMQAVVNDLMFGGM